MSKLNGFLQLRRGIFEHVRDGRITSTQAFCYIYMLTQADTRTGIWSGSAGALAGELAMPIGTARHILEAIDDRYIRRFTTPGRHFCYPIALHKFLITEGEHKGKHLNALDSVSPTDLRYFSHEQNLEQDDKQVGEHVGAQKRIENREQRNKKSPAAKPEPPADPRHSVVFALCCEAYKARFGEAPTWGRREGKTLQRFLRENPRLHTEEIVRRYGNFLASTEPYHERKHGSLLHLLSNFDAFADGPIYKTFSSKEGGQSRAEERERNNLRAAGFI
jgi:hypothetical protein